MGMGMAEGEWAAKRGLPAPKLAGERAGSLGGRQATSRRLAEAVPNPNSFHSFVRFLSKFSRPSRSWMFSNTWFSFSHLGFSGGGGSSCS